MEGRERSSVVPGPARVVVVSALLVGVVAAILAAGQASAAGAAAKVDTATTAIGKVLVTAQGRTLYVFALDKQGKSACYGQCAHYWPPLLTTGKPTAGAGAKASLLGTTKRKDGKLQVTYNGHPLYRYVSDTKAGQTNGQGLNLSGGLWWALFPNGAIDKKKPSSGGGGGYG
jgi:predicted lipoprotein with Yx(FWY)xxD motif